MRPFLIVILTVVCLSVSAVTGQCPGGKQIGDTWTEQDCVGCTCKSYGLQCKGCGLMQLPPDSNCRMVENKAAPYPACCPQVEC